jgi:hypothetical protein
MVRAICFHGAKLSTGYVTTFSAEVVSSTKVKIDSLNKDACIHAFHPCHSWYPTPIFCIKLAHSAVRTSPRGRVILSKISIHLLIKPINTLSLPSRGVPTGCSVVRPAPLWRHGAG